MQTLPNAILPIDLINLFSKIAVNFQPMQCNNAILMFIDIYNFLKSCYIVYFMTGRSISKRLGGVAPESLGSKKVTQSVKGITTVFVEQPLASPGSA